MSDQINWQTEWEAVLAQAKKDDKPILFELYLDGCPHCARLHKETLVDPQVIEAVQARFIPIRLEGRANMELVKKFEVKGAPTTLILSSQGQDLHRFIGFQTPSEYLKELSAVG